MSLSKLALQRAHVFALLAASAAVAAACSSQSPEIPGLHEVGGDVPSGGDDGKKKTNTSTPPVPSTETPAPSTSQPPPPAPQADQPPTVTSVDPQAATIGSMPNGIDVSITGTKFPSTAQVSLAGTKLPTTFVSPTQLKVHLGADQMRTAGTLRLLVSTAAGDSNALTFTVANPTSTSIATLTPANVVLGATDPVALTITGTGFTDQSVVKFNGAALATTFTSSTALSAMIPVTAFLDAGRMSITVSIGTDVVSLPSPFEVRNPSPTATSTAPATMAAGTTSATVTLTGNGFTKGTSVLANGQAVSTTFVSATSVRANIPSNLIAKAGSVALTVQNGTPGGGTSTAVTLSITAADTGTSGGSSGTSGGTKTTGPDCPYLCKDYGYAPGQCYADYYCIQTGTYAGCLGQASCDGAPDNGGGSAGSSGSSGSSGSGGSSSACTYKCTDYGYDPGECSGGWYCWISDGCLTQSVCSDDN